MAKVKLSALIDNISGKLGGSTFKRNKGGLLLMKTMKPRNPRSSQQQRLRGYASYFSGKYDSLTDTYKMMWEQYASLLGTKSTGCNAYVSLNLNIAHANSDSIPFITNPPLSPSTPTFPIGFEVRTISSVKNTLYWSSPSSSSLFVCASFAAQSGYSHKGKESWQLITTAVSTDGHIDHVHDYPVGTIFSYLIYTIDLSGRCSPYSHASTGTFSAPVYSAGRYGATSYGFSCYSGSAPFYSAGRYGATSYGFSYYSDILSVLITDASVGDHSTNVMNAFIYGFGSIINSSHFTITNATFQSGMDYALANGISLMVRSTTNMSTYISDALTHYPDVLAFMPAGSNSYIEIYDSGDVLPVIVVAGAGDIANETGWDIEFFDADPFTPEPSDWSSYSNGVIAGKLYKIKHTLDCSWWEARYRARMTSSRADNWNNVDGFGIIDVDAAIAWYGDVPVDPFI